MLLPLTGLLRPLALAGAVALASFAALQSWRLQALRTEFAEAQAEWQAESAAAARAAAETSERHRATEAALAAAAQENADAARQALDRARHDAAGARAAAGRLRDAAATAAAACDRGAPSDSTAAAGSAPAAGPGLVLADVLGFADDAAGELAEAVDRSRAAGLACERSYDRALEMINGAPTDR